MSTVLSKTPCLTKKSRMEFLRDGRTKIPLGKLTIPPILFQKLKQGRIAQLINSNEKEVAYAAYFFIEEDTLYAKVEMYNVYGTSINPAFNNLDKFVLTDALFTPDVVDEWMTKSTLWFRKDRYGRYESYIDYMDEYRPLFSVNPSSPLISFTIPV